MNWEFSEDFAFLALCEAFRESGENSAIEFLANGEGAFLFQDLIQNAAGEIQEIPEKDVPRVVHRPSHYKPFSRHIPKSQRQKPQPGVARKREGESQNE